MTTSLAPHGHDAILKWLAALRGPRRARPQISRFYWQRRDGALVARGPIFWQTVGHSGAASTQLAGLGGTDASYASPRGLKVWASDFGLAPLGGTDGSGCER